MILRFTKGDGKPDTLTCVRDDGSVTFASSSVGTMPPTIPTPMAERFSANPPAATLTCS